MNTILKSQSGRSMVEMLGVLAIIGVLSVGGIAGYRQAMLQKNLNDIAQGVSLALIEAETYLEQTGELGRDFENYIGNYRIYANTWDFSNHFPGSEIVIIVSPLSKEVCEAILYDQRIPFENLGIIGWRYNISDSVEYPETTGDGWTGCEEEFNRVSLYF